MEAKVESFFPSTCHATQGLHDQTFNKCILATKLWSSDDILIIRPSKNSLGYILTVTVTGVGHLVNPCHA